MTRDIGADFRALHVPGKPFVLVNVWDAGTARMMAGLGAQALATSSAAHAFTLGRPDGGTLTRDAALAHAQDIVAATALPVQGDFENGFGDAPEDCAQTVRLAAEAGLAGICIEDTMLPSDNAYDADLAAERIAAAASAARALGRDFVLTARADGLLTGRYGREEALRRLAAFEAAGADCLYAPLPASMADLAAICAATTLPVNALVAGWATGHSAADFAAIGVARLSLGSSLARLAQRAVHDAGRAMLEAGDFTALRGGMPGAQVDALLAAGSSSATGGA